jgi:hypothetical protein
MNNIHPLFLHQFDYELQYYWTFLCGWCWLLSRTYLADCVGLSSGSPC